jgi:hypothetical protein
VSQSERLADANAQVAKAVHTLDGATAAAAKAAEFAAAIDAEVAAHVERDRKLAAERAEDLKRSLRSGAAPTLNSSPAMTKVRAQLIEVQDRQAIARKAADDLSAEAEVAKVALDSARAEVESAVRGLLSDKAEVYASAVVALESEAKSKRAQLEEVLRSSASGWGGASAAKIILSTVKFASQIEGESEQAVAGEAADNLDAARSLAAKVISLECDALASRAELEGVVRSGVLGWRKQTALTSVAQRVVQENLSTSIAVKNSPEWAAANQAAEGWRTRHAELLRRSDDAVAVGAAA